MCISIANDSIGISTWQAVVAATLDVERDEVHADTEGRLLGEETLADLLGEELVVRLTRLLDQTAHDGVHAAAVRVVQRQGASLHLRTRHNRDTSLSDDIHVST